jgi:hypothetical protein
MQEVERGTARDAEAVVESDAAFRDIGLAVDQLADDLRQLVRTDDSAGHLLLERQTGVQVVDVDCTAAAAR